MDERLPSTPIIIHWIKEAAKVLLQPLPPDTPAGMAKDPQGNILTIRDRQVQHEIASYIVSGGYRYVIVGEEELDDVPENFCSALFPQTLHADQIVAIIDPTDGSKNWTIGKEYSVTFALQKGHEVIVAVVYFPLRDHIYALDPSAEMTKNHETFTPIFKRLSDRGLSICYGLGKALTKSEEQHFLHLLVSLSDDEVELSRLGCASASFFEVFCGRSDCYASAKERWTNIAPLYKFAKHLGYHVTININSLDKNKDFRIVVCTPDFAEKYLYENSLLGIFINKQ